MNRQNGPWTITGTNLVYKNRFIEVHEDQVVQPDGAPGTYATVRAQLGVSVLPVDDEGNLYLLRQFRYALGKDSLEVCSGSLNEGEAPLEAAERELSEELGFEAADWTPLGQVNLDTSVVWGPVYLFLARDLTFGQSHREGTETMKTIKISLAEAIQMVDESQINHGPSCVLILKAARFLEKLAGRPLTR